MSNVHCRSARLGSIFIHTIFCVIFPSQLIAYKEKENDCQKIDNAYVTGNTQSQCSAPMVSAYISYCVVGFRVAFLEMSCLLVFDGATEEFRVVVTFMSGLRDGILTGPQRRPVFWGPYLPR